MIKRFGILICLIVALCALSSCGSEKNNSTSSEKAQGKETSPIETDSQSSKVGGETNTSSGEKMQSGDTAHIDIGGFSITLSKDLKWDSIGKEDAILFPVAVKNNSNREDGVWIHECLINGQKIDCMNMNGKEPFAMFSWHAQPGEEIKTNIAIVYMKSWPDFQSLDYIKEIQFTFNTSNSGETKTITFTY